jgi:hypothetical protein
MVSSCQRMAPLIPPDRALSAGAARDPSGTPQTTAAVALFIFNPGRTDSIRRRLPFR